MEVAIMASLPAERYMDINARHKSGKYSCKNIKLIIDYQE
jgi:hypothetical protein